MNWEDKVVTVHLLTIEEAEGVISGQEKATSLCTNYTFSPVVIDNNNELVSFLTVQEYLLNTPNIGAEGITSLTLMAYNNFKRMICKECKDHENLPLIALKECT